MELCNDSLEVSSFLGDLKQGVADELKEQVQRFSFKEQYRRITEMVESKINNTMHSLEKQLEERTTRLLTYTMWIATRYWAGSMNKLLSHRRSTRKGNLYSSYAKLLTYTVWIATRYWAGSMNRLLSHLRSTRKGNLYSSYAKLLTYNVWISMRF
ncbi:hypothetical protein KY289_030556 [Solanum tuberosum]|nr:hypothetical protein KY289_030556 [Solanum tuberosum]